VGLLTTVTRGFQRISMHGVREELLDRQASSLKLPLHKIYLSQVSSNEEYETEMRRAMNEFKGRGIDTIAFGDIYLEDVRRYREDKLAQVGMNAAFPLWRKDSAALASRFIDSGFKAITSCVDTEQLDGNFTGRLYDGRFLEELPAEVDPCGENGEFHSFVFDGPVFAEPIGFSIGEKVLRDNRFYYCDLLPITT